MEVGLAVLVGVFQGRNGLVPLVYQLSQIAHKLLLASSLCCKLTTPADVQNSVMVQACEILVYCTIANATMTAQLEAVAHGHLADETAGLQLQDWL